MEAIYSLNSNELDINFIDSIKKAFKGKDINIIVTDNSIDQERAEELQNRLKSYKENPDNILQLDSDFWEETRKKLKAL